MQNLMDNINRQTVQTRSTEDTELPLFIFLTEMVSGIVQFGMRMANSQLLTILYEFRRMHSLMMSVIYL